MLAARLLGSKVDGGARIELLLLRRLEKGAWEALAKPGRRLKPGSKIMVGAGPMVEAEVMAKTESGNVVVEFSDEGVLEAVGAVPLPPYIRRPIADSEIN